MAQTFLFGAGVTKLDNDNLVAAGFHQTTANFGDGVCDVWVKNLGHTVLFLSPLTPPFSSFVTTNGFGAQDRDIDTKEELNGWLADIAKSSKKHGLTVN